jgi:hypothetical protein
MKRLALSGLLLIILLIALPALSQSDVEGSPEMAPVPTDCGILPDSISPDPGIPSAIGTFPIWLGITDGVLPMPTEHYQENPQLPGWWATKVGWLIPKVYTGTVQVRGWNVADDSPMYFEFGDDGALTSAALDPDEPGGFVDGLEDWAFFPSYVWVPKAGCYRLRAEWNGGLWEQVIAVGSDEAIASTPPQTPRSDPPPTAASA